ncbi:hypothetical protein A9239_16945 [Methanosarcina sp. A14]|nr:hypothetical protein A9239_16945 [Methanosarcina sp. A14]
MLKRAELWARVINRLGGRCPFRSLRSLKRAELWIRKAIFLMSSGCLIFLNFLGHADDVVTLLFNKDLPLSFSKKDLSEKRKPFEFDSLVPKPSLRGQPAQ